MPQEDRIISTGREAIASLRDDYRDFCDDPEESFEEFAGEAFNIFNSAPDAVFSYDPQISVGSIRRLPEPSHEELLALYDLASTQLMGRARNCANPHDMARYAMAAEWIETNGGEELALSLTAEERNRITIGLAENDRIGAAEVLEDSALENITHAHGPMGVGEPSTERPEVFCTIQWSRDDIVEAIEGEATVHLDRNGPQAEQVEALIDQTIGEVRKGLQDSSIEHGWGIIDVLLPEEVIQQAKDLDKYDRNNVRDWYTHTFPTDDLGNELNPDLTFDTALGAVALGEGFYDVLGESDSVVRERVFGKLADRYGIDYDTIYNAWLNKTPVPGCPPELTSHVPEEGLHKQFPLRLADEAASSRMASDTLDGITGHVPAQQQER